jgi:hypothetical protein
LSRPRAQRERFVSAKLKQRTSDPDIHFPWDACKRSQTISNHIQNASFSPNKFPGIQPWQPAGIAATKPICHIPGDLRWHGGHLGQNNYWDEWHYWTLLGVDEITGK